MPALPEFIDVTPAPRILPMLGEIPFAPWQCLAELIDNATDAFMDAERAGEPVPNATIQIGLPTPAEAKRGAGRVEVVDNAPGMTLEKLNSCVRAGFSGNDPISKLGLFGMGFNIATARLGSTTEILTSRVGDESWYGVRLDFDALQRQGNYLAEVITAPKDLPTAHGTRIRVTKLKPQIADHLADSRHKSEIRRTLGRVYSRLVTSRNLRIEVSSVQVKAERHCVWSNERTVTRGGERIPAILQVDEPLPPRRYCTSCWRWLEEGQDPCDNCLSSDAIVTRERHIRGWLGIQRYFDHRHWGIDFIRNGRKILVADQRPFTWTDPYTGQTEPEYPIDDFGRSGGRIVGEIELDHVRVPYQKNEFDTTDPAWTEALNYLRGDGPIRPEKYREFTQGGANRSPLATLFRGYRRADPGIDYLVPGKNKKMVNDLEWVQKFEEGDPEYQTDEKWYQAVLEVERELRNSGAMTAPGRADIVTDLLGRRPPHEIPTGDQVGDPPLPGQERAGSSLVPPKSLDPVEELRSRSVKDEVRSREYRPNGIDVPEVKLTVYRLTSGQLRSESGKHRLAVRLFVKASHEDTIFYDPDAPIFREFPDEPDDLILLELASVFRTHLGTGSAQARDWSLSRVYEQLKRQYLDADRIDLDAIGARARGLLNDLREAAPELIKEDPDRAYSHLSQAERDYFGGRIARDYSQGLSAAQALQQTGQFVKYCPPSFFPTLVREWPGVFMDGAFWVIPYAEVYAASDEAADRIRDETADRMGNYLSDVVWLVDRLGTGGDGGPNYKSQLIRAAHSLDLLDQWRARD